MRGLLGWLSAGATDRFVDAHAAPAFPVEVGSLVVFHDLHSRHDLNGRQGVVRARHGTDRWAVEPTEDTEEKQEFLAKKQEQQKNFQFNKAKNNTVYMVKITVVKRIWSCF